MSALGTNKVRADQSMISILTLPVLGQTVGDYKSRDAPAHYDIVICSPIERLAACGRRRS
jgi:hypothetical protein